MCEQIILLCYTVFEWYPICLSTLFLGHPVDTLLQFWIKHCCWILSTRCYGSYLLCFLPNTPWKYKHSMHASSIWRLKNDLACNFAKCSHVQMHNSLQLFSQINIIIHTKNVHISIPCKCWCASVIHTSKTWSEIHIDYHTTIIIKYCSCHTFLCCKAIQAMRLHTLNSFIDVHYTVFDTYHWSLHANEGWFSFLKYCSFRSLFHRSIPIKPILLSMFVQNAFLMTY